MVSRDDEAEDRMALLLERVRFLAGRRTKQAEAVSAAIRRNREACKHISISVRANDWRCRRCGLHGEALRQALDDGA